MPDAMALRMRDELIAERDRARDAVFAAAVDVADATDEQVLACAEVLTDRVIIWQAAEEAARPPRGSYRNARGIITPVVDELPEITIRRMRDGDQP